MTDRTLIRVASELRGNESYLLDASPVFREDETPFIAEGGRPPRSIHEYETSVLRRARQRHAVSP
ncbi:hypothetical protein [Curtobacterium sp. MCSS17_016]|uniref:hypothetical protein n=1 Tax=Curtobacterium sp. MCSS17_016 TaxID=2175644 RepID=UPI000DA7F102|nr:hypothetical protein [Curtobacterium sp. MCSS17_016]WIE81419.1 hypothetical protein DEJ19_019480 [Curtobacterium sp. MCSS17_016]